MTKEQTHKDEPRALQSSEVHKALASADLKQRLTGGGIEPLTSTPQEFASFIQAETVRYAKVIKGAGIKAE